MAITAAQARRTLGTMRIALGTASLLAPRQVGRVFGMSPEDNPVSPFLARLFGFRNVALGLDLVQGDGSGSLPQYNVAIDVGDAAAIIAGGAGGYLSKRTVVMGMAAALLATSLGVMGARDA